MKYSKNNTSIIFKDIIYLIKNILYKNSNIANKSENIVSFKYYNNYISYKHGTDTLNMYISYLKSYIEYGITKDRVGDSIYIAISDDIPIRFITSTDIIKNSHGMLIYSTDIIYDTENKKATYLDLYRWWCYTTYAEHNMYYTDYSGIPNYYLDSDLIVSVPVDYYSNINTMKNVYISKISDRDLNYLENNGEIDKLIKKYIYDNESKITPPENYMYLKNLRNKFDILQAREAKQFELIKVPKIKNSKLSELFIKVYSECRDYIVNNLYQKDLIKVIDYYDEYMAMVVAIMTLQYTLSNSIKESIRRNFVTESLLADFYNNYSIPYESLLDSETHQLIVSNVNKLIQYAGTKKVLFDIVSLLGKDNVKLYSYYIMKDILPDEVDPDVYFCKVDIKETDIYNSLKNRFNRVEYSAVVENDHSWYDDDELKSELYNATYNFIESKYIGLSIMYRMSDIVYNSMYLLRLLLDNKTKLGNITLDIPKIQNEPIDLFSSVVLLLALICKYNKFSSNILGFDQQIILKGYNTDYSFSGDFITECKLKLKNYYMKELEIGYNGNKRFISVDIIYYLDSIFSRLDNNWEVYDIDNIIELGLNDGELNKSFKNILDMRNIIENQMYFETDLDRYRLLKQIYDTIYNVTIQNHNGGIFREATSYINYIELYYPKIYNEIIMNEEVDLLYFINHVIYKLLNVFDNSKYIHISLSNLGISHKVLIDMINRFKDFTVKLIDYQVIYVLDTKIDLSIKCIDKIHRIEKHLTTEFSPELHVSDMLVGISKTTAQQDSSRTKERVKIYYKD